MAKRGGLESGEGEDVVITGMSGAFAASDNVHHFRDNLFGKVNMVSGVFEKWKTHPIIPKKYGKLPNVEKFDAGFFGIPSRQTGSMDPVIRLLLEKTTEAIIDAGHHPSSLENTSTGIFTVSNFSETERIVFYDITKSLSDAITGSHTSMLAKRLSYYLKLKGPSYQADTACSGSIYAIEEAIQAIKTHKCDKALVCSGHLCLCPLISIGSRKRGFLCHDGNCKTFDNSADGYARSEAVVVLLLERRKDAKRIYAEVIHAKSNCDGFKHEGIMFPSSDTQKILLEDFYDECKIDPINLTFMEAHGTGTKIGDFQELKALDEVLCKNRNTPLYVGSIKSNVGHTEATGGLCSIVKIILAMETGFIPPNLHYSTPQKGIKPLEHGRMLVATEKVPLPDQRGLFDCKSSYTDFDNQVILSGKMTRFKWKTTVLGVNSFGFGGSNAHALLHWNAKISDSQEYPDDIPRLICVTARVKEGVEVILEDFSKRGCGSEYGCLIQQAFQKPHDNHMYRGYGIYNKQKEIKRSVRRLRTFKENLCLIFNCPDEKWLKFGHELMVIPIFSGTIRCIKNILLKVIDLNLCEFFNNSKDKQPTEVSLASLVVQIGLVTILKKIKLHPDSILGNGSGELIAAYMDDYLTLEQTILILYYTTTNISGDKNNKYADSSLKFATSKNNSIQNGLIDTLSLVNRKYSVSKNLPNFMMTKQTRRVPETTYFIVGTHLDKISNDCVQLVNVNSKNCIFPFLDNLGRIYEMGFSMELDKLYPPIQFPVSRGTPMLSPLIKWNHQKNCKVHMLENEKEGQDEHRTVLLDIKSEEWAFVIGHVLDGRNLFPASGYLFLAWETLANSVGKCMDKMKVVFQDVKFIRATYFPHQGFVKLNIDLQLGTKYFEITEGGSIIATGRIYEELDDEPLTELPITPIDAEHLCMDTEDVYTVFKLRGYQYSGGFKSIRKSNVTPSQAIIEWNDNWIQFIDCVLQTKLLWENTRETHVPIAIQHIVIDAPEHFSRLKEYQNMYPVYMYPEFNTIRSIGVEMRGIIDAPTAKRKPADPILEAYKFVPNHAAGTAANSIRSFVQIILENVNVVLVTVIEVCPIYQEKEQLLYAAIQSALNDTPQIQQDITILSERQFDLPGLSVENQPLNTKSNCLLLVVSNLLDTVEVPAAFNAIKAANGFIITREKLDVDLSKFASSPFTVLCSHACEQETLVLLRSTPSSSVSTNYLNLSDITENFQWIPVLQEKLRKGAKVIFYSQNDELSGILGLMTCLRKEYKAEKIGCILIVDEAPTFDPDLPFYKDQLKKNMTVNVWRGGSWGTYRFLPVVENVVVERENCYVNASTRGDLSTLTWLKGLQHVVTSERGRVYVHYISLNTRDLMVASGKMAPELLTKDRTKHKCLLGTDFSGIDSRGIRVMGMVEVETLSRPVRSNFLIPIPDEWTMEDAATIMASYYPVIKLFVQDSNPKPGSSILIHNATDDVGFAAMNLCLHFGLTIFVTVETIQKREFLRKHYPQIEEERIGSSTDASFEEMIWKGTNGRGVDYVLNCLVGEKLSASLRCLAEKGTFFEFGDVDLSNDNALALSLLEKEGQFVGVGTDKDVTSDNGKQIRKLIEHGAIKPLPRSIYNSTEIQEAFKYVNSGKSIGKILMKITTEQSQEICLPTSAPLRAIPRFYCRPECSYLICGSLGGFGLEVADFLITRGAKKLVLTSRSGLSNGYQRFRIRIWRNYGVKVIISSIDAANESGCLQLLKIANELGPIDGIFNFAVVLNDALFENLSVDAFKVPFSGKVDVTRNLDFLSRNLCPNLRYFVVFSSVTAGRGMAGQTNYGMANSIMERICLKRKRERYPALAIQWGPIKDVGAMIKLQRNNKNFEIHALASQEIASCLQVLDRYLIQDEPVVSSILVGEKRNKEEKRNLFDAVVHMLGIRNLKSVSTESTISEIGADSIMVVEIMQFLQREYKLSLKPKDIREMTLSGLKKLSDSKSSVKVSAQETETFIPPEAKLFLSYLGKQTVANIPMIKLKTLIDDDDSSAPHILAFPGIEGVAAILEPLCKKLKAHVSCLQYGIGRNVGTINELAESLLPYVKPNNNDLIMLAYSYGGLVATELLSILESKGRTAKIIFIDASPKLVMEMVKYFPLDDEHLFQTFFLCSVLPSDNDGKHEESIVRRNTYHDKIERFISLLPNVETSKQHIVGTCKSVYDRLKAVRVYSPTNIKLASTLTLFKATESLTRNIVTDYGLSTVFANVGDIINIEGNHVSILENDDLAGEINRILDV